MPSKSCKEKTFRPIVKESINLLQSTLPKNITVQQRVTADPDKTTGDPTQIHQAIMNLCTNAYHAMRHVIIIDDAVVCEIAAASTEQVQGIGHRRHVQSGPGKRLLFLFDQKVESDHSAADFAP